MEHSAPQPLELIRPWKRATIVVTAVAGVELVALVAGASILLGNPLLNRLGGDPASAAAPRVRTLAETRAEAASKTTLQRSETSVLVLNANGRAGAAAAGADRIRARGYVVGSVGNAPGSGSTRTLVMYRPGFEAEGARLARDLHVRIVTPLDGMRPGQLMGAHLVLILGT